MLGYIFYKLSRIVDVLKNLTLILGVSLHPGFLFFHKGSRLLTIRIKNLSLLLDILHIIRLACLD